MCNFTSEQIRVHLIDWVCVFVFKLYSFVVLRLFSLCISPLSLCRAAVENEVHFTLCCSALKDLRQRLIPDKFYSQPTSFRPVLLLSTENKVITNNFAISLYLAFKRRELLLRE